MVRRSIPAAVHVVTIREQRILFTDSKLFPLVQLVVCFDTGFQHYPLETVFTVLPYRGVENTTVTIITGVSQMIVFSLFIIDRLTDISLFCDGIPNSVYYPVHNLFNVKFQRHDKTVRGEIFGRVRHRNSGYPHPRLRVLVIREAVQPPENFFSQPVRVVIIG